MADGGGGERRGDVAASDAVVESGATPIVANKLQAVTSVAVLSALGMGAGYARDAAVAAWFGASAVTDAFFVATIIPTAIAAVAISGTLAPALLPVFADSLRTPRDAWALADSVLTVAAGALLALSAAAAIAA